MTTSKKILITAVGIIIAVLITGLMMIRDIVENMPSNNLVKIQFFNVPVQPFDQLDVSGDWQVTIRQGREYKVEWGSESDTIVIPTIQNKNGVLYLKAAINQNYTAKITAPLISQIKSSGKAKVNMNNFVLDSLNVYLDDGGAFIGKENKFKFVRYKTKGEVLLELTDDPMK